MNDLLAVNEEAKRNGQKQHCRAPVKRMLLWMFSSRISLALSETVMKSKQPCLCQTKDSWATLGILWIQVELEPLAADRSIFLMSLTFFEKLLGNDIHCHKIKPALISSRHQWREVTFYIVWSLRIAKQLKRKYNLLINLIRFHFENIQNFWATDAGRCWLLDTQILSARTHDFNQLTLPK